MSRISTLDDLDPAFRLQLDLVLVDIAAEALPLKIFESIRSPSRQDELFAKGRTVEPLGRFVTRARAYQSGHQHGLAVDVVGFVDGKWTWDLPTKTWHRLGELAKRHGLTQLSFEQPHLEPIGFDWRKLKTGPSGDAAWLEWLKSRVA